jgi:hypothetical protein
LLALPAGTEAVTVGAWIAGGGVVPPPPLVPPLAMGALVPRVGLWLVQPSMNATPRISERAVQPACSPVTVFMHPAFVILNYTSIASPDQAIFISICRLCR